MITGISTGLFYDRDLIGLLPFFKNAGFEYLEIWTGKGAWGQEKHFDYYDVEYRRRLKESLRDLGLKVISVHAPFSDEMDLSSLDPVKSKFAFLEISLALEVLTELEGEYLVFHPAVEIRSEKSNFTGLHERRIMLWNKLEKILSQAIQHRKILLAENPLPHIFFGNRRDFSYLLELFTHSSLGVCFDTSHAHLSGAFPEMLESVLPRVKTFHISDNRGIYDDHLMPGEGRINWKQFFGILKRKPSAPVFILEVLGEYRRFPPEEILPVIREKAEIFFREHGV